MANDSSCLNPLALLAFGVGAPWVQLGEPMGPKRPTKGLVSSGR